MENIKYDYYKSVCNIVKLFMSARYNYADINHTEAFKQDLISAVLASDILGTVTGAFFSNENRAILALKNDNMHLITDAIIYFNLDSHVSEIAPYPNKCDVLIRKYVLYSRIDNIIDDYCKNFETMYPNNLISVI